MKIEKGKVFPDTVQEAVKAGLIELPKPGKKMLALSAVPHMIAMAKMGLKQEEIGKALGRHTSAVCQSLNRYGQMMYLTHDEVAAIAKRREENG